MLACSGRSGKVVSGVSRERHKDGAVLALWYAAAHLPAVLAHEELRASLRAP